MLSLFLCLYLSNKKYQNKTARYCTDPQRPGQCAAHEWQCDNRNCISNDFVCDQQPDCTDSSDEIRGCLEGKVFLSSLNTLYMNSMYEIKGHNLNSKNTQPIWSGNVQIVFVGSISLCSLYVCDSICVYFQYIYFICCYKYLLLCTSRTFFFQLCDKDYNFQQNKIKYINLKISNFIVITARTTPSPSPSCRPDEIYCDGYCHPPQIRCNNNLECSNGIDEENCPNSLSTTQSPSLTVLILNL